MFVLQMKEITSCYCSVWLDEGRLQRGQFLNSRGTNTVVGLDCLRLLSIQENRNDIGEFPILRGLRGQRMGTDSELVLFSKNILSKQQPGSYLLETLNAAARRSPLCPIISPDVYSPTPGSSGLAIFFRI